MQAHEPVLAEERAAADVVADRLGGIRIRQAELALQFPDRRSEGPCPRDPGIQPVALADELPEALIDHHVAGNADHGAERAAERPVAIGGGRGEHAPARRFEKRIRIALVEHLEVSGHVGLEGELVEEPLAEGVDGLDLQAARRFQGGREEPAGAGELAGIRAPALQLANLLGELRIVEPRPFGERVEDALRHLGRRGAGEGEAEDMAGIGAGKEQPHDAAREHEGLARAGIGRDPGRGARVRCRGLRELRRVVDGQGFGGACHNMSSSLSTRLHSWTRARWS